MEKKKIYFLAPKNKGGTYYYYKKISEYLIKNDSDIYEVYFVNSLFDYIKLHFIKTDYIFSIIPFLFKPIFTKKYIFNLHGNFEIERKNKGLGVKLLYLSELNLWFSDSIMLTSYYLADKLKFKKKYDNKIIIVPNFVDETYSDIKKINNKKINLLTASNSDFLKKGLGVLNLAKQVFSITDLQIEWKVILPGINRDYIISEIKKLNKPDNISVNYFNFIDKDKLNIKYIESDIFIYDSELETWGGTIMEACSFGKPIILLENELWNYIYPKDFITKDLKNRINFIIDNYESESKKSLDFVNNFLLEKIVNKYIIGEINS